MESVLTQLLGTIATGKSAVDADMPFLVQLETIILQKIHDPITRMQQAGLMPPGGPGQAGPPGQQGGPPPQMPMGPPPGAGGPSFQGSGMGGAPGGGVRGVAPGAAAPNTDELRRMLSQR